MKSVLVIGLGSLTKKIIYNLANQGNINIIVLSRSTAEKSWLALCDLCEGVRVTFVKGSGLDRGLVCKLLKQYQPDLIINGASLISPFCLVGHEKADALKKAGFALQIGSQISVIMAVMQVVKELYPHIPVINCSFPDLTNPILSKLNLAPTVGIGNVSMLEMIARKAVLSSNRYSPNMEIRVLGHHAHVLPILRNSVAEMSQQPLVFCEEQAIENVFDDIELSFSTEEINYFTAISAMPVINGLLWQDSIVKCSAPGAFGMAGGIPIVIENGKLSADLPNSLTPTDVANYFKEALILDGVSSIEEDGTVQFSERYIELVSDFSPKLAEAFRPTECVERHKLFLDTFFPRGMG